MLLQQAELFWEVNWLTIVTFVVGVGASWLFAWLYFKKSAQQKRLWFSRQQSPIFSKIVDDIGITYRGHEVRNPHIAEFLVWNSGNTTIRSSDVSAHSPIRFSADNMKFYSAEITLTTKKESNVTATVHDDTVLVQFDYMDVGDGFVIEMVADDIGGHENDRSNRPDIGLFGTLIGQSSPPTRVKAYLSKEQYFGISFINYTTRAMGLIMIGVGAYTLFFRDSGVANALSYPLQYSQSVSIISFVYGAIMIGLSFMLRRRRPPLGLMRSDPATQSIGSLSATTLLKVLAKALIR